MRTLLLAALGLAILPLASTAQQWSSEEQGVLDFTMECWDMWGQEQADPYLAQCWHEDITFWWSEHALPFGARWVSRSAPAWFAGYSWRAWDVQPHTIKIYGNAAVIQYQLLIVFGPDGGNLEEYAGGRTDVLVREGGAWKVVAVHEHPAPLNR